MKLIIVMLIGSLTYSLSHAFTQKHIERLKKMKEISYADLAHENPGCPENSECSKANGKRLLQWESLLKQHGKNPKQLAKKVENFRKKNGIPTLFLAKDSEKLKQSIDPIIWDSRCRHHNLKDKDKIIKGMKFFINNPKSKDIIFTSIKIGKNSYEIPYGDQALMVWNKSLVIIKNYDDYLYQLSVNDQGQWKVINLPSHLLKKGRISKSDVPCEKKALPDQYFLGSYCTKIWNEDIKDYQVAQQSWSCP